MFNELFMALLNIGKTSTGDSHNYGMLVLSNERRQSVNKKFETSPVPFVYVGLLFVDDALFFFQRLPILVKIFVMSELATIIIVILLTILRVNG